MISHELLEEAASQLDCDVAALTADPALDRDRSRVTPLRFEGRIVAWHKQILAGGDAPGEHDTATAQMLLSRAMGCTTAALRLISDEPDMAIAPVLAVDPATLCIVTGHVAGDPLSRHFPRVDRQLPKLPRRLTTAGRCLALIESASPVSERTDPTNAVRRLRYPFEVISDNPTLLVDGLELAQLSDRVDQAVDSIERAGFPATHVHGDASLSNILVRESTVGLIDVEWPCRLVGFDLATLAVRLELTAARTPLVGRWATARLVEGYCSATPLGAGFHFERTQRYVRLMASGLVTNRQAQRVVRTYLSSTHPSSSPPETPARGSLDSM